MTGGQLRRMLDRAGLSQRGASREIGISERQMRRYIAGEAPIPRVVQLALFWVVHLRKTSAREGEMPRTPLRGK